MPLTKKPRKGDYLLYDNKIIYQVIGWHNAERTIAIIRDVKTLHSTCIIVQFSDTESNHRLEPIEICDRRCNPCLMGECNAREVPPCPDCWEAPCKCFEGDEDDEPET